MAELLAFPFWEIARLIFQALPAVLLSPTHALFFWLIIFLVAMQHRRMADMETALYGRTRVNVWRRTLDSVAHGLVGGIVASFLLVFTGVSLGEGDVLYLWPVALLLMLIHPRFLCFSYAATLIGLSHLVLGWPQVNVAGLVGLVAILHVVEGVLVWLSGGEGAIPMYVGGPRGKVAGGFSIQQFWPVPLAVLFALVVPSELQSGAVSMPDWWPIIAPPEAVLTSDDVSLVLWPVAAALGYSDMALQHDPQTRSRQAAKYLLLYSGVLLALAVAGSQWPSLLWIAVLASGGLHEWMIQVGLRGQALDGALYVAPDRGVLVMDVFPGGYAEHLGLRRGDIILAVNGRPVRNRHDLALYLREASFYLELTLDRDHRTVTLTTNRFQYRAGQMGFIPAPEPGDEPQVRLGGGGVLLRWLRRLLAILGRGQ